MHMVEILEVILELRISNLSNQHTEQKPRDHQSCIELERSQSWRANNISKYQ